MLNRELVIDAHHHLIGEEGYIDKLIKTMKLVGIDKVCLSGLGIGNGLDDFGKFNLGSLSPSNDDVLSAMQKYPEHIIGFGVIQLGRDNVSRVDELYQQGFKGIKVTRPLADYNHDDYMDIYARIAELNMPILFHTGVVLVTQADVKDDVCSDRMRPIKIDRIARRFPKLKIILAHMGVPWFTEAAEMARFHKNVFVDLTGSNKGWRNRKSTAFFQELFYWENAFNKIIFGTDVVAEEIADSYESQKRIFNLAQVSDNVQRRIFGRTMAEILKLS